MARLMFVVDAERWRRVGDGGRMDGVKSGGIGDGSSNQRPATTRRRCVQQVHDRWVPSVTI